MPWIIAFVILFLISGDLFAPLLTLGVLWVLLKIAGSPRTPNGEVDNDGNYGDFGE